MLCCLANLNIYHSVTLDNLPKKHLNSISDLGNTEKYYNTRLKLKCIKDINNQDVIKVTHYSGKFISLHEHLSYTLKK